MAFLNTGTEKVEHRRDGVEGSEIRTQFVNGPGVMSGVEGTSADRNHSAVFTCSNDSLFVASTVNKPKGRHIMGVRREGGSSFLDMFQQKRHGAVDRGG